MPFRFYLLSMKPNIKPQSTVISPRNEIFTYAERNLNIDLPVGSCQACRRVFQFASFNLLTYSVFCHYSDNLQRQSKFI